VAFLVDFLDHFILLEKLYNLNTNPDVLLWFKITYQMEQTHCVKLSGNFSECRSMKGRIPQGSALIISYLYNSGLLLQYADNTALICCGLSNLDVAAKINHQLELVSRPSGLGTTR